MYSSFELYKAIIAWLSLKTLKYIVSVDVMPALFWAVAVNITTPAKSKSPLIFWIVIFNSFQERNEFFVYFLSNFCLIVVRILDACYNGFIP